MITEILLAAFVIMSSSLLGIIFVQKNAEGFLEKNLSFLVSFSAGVFLVTAGGLGLEVFELTTSVWTGVGLIAFGYALAWCLHKLMPETHHHHDQDCVRSREAAKKLIVGDGIHNIADGVILVVVFTASPTLGLAAATSIFIHESLQGVSEFFIFRQAGYSIKKALAVNFAISSTILVGVVLGYYALASKGLEIILLAISAGFFLHIVIHDLLPKRSHHESTKKFIKHLLLVLLGTLIMGSLANYLGDSHEHDEGDAGTVSE